MLPVIPAVPATTLAFTAIAAITLLVLTALALKYDVTGEKYADGTYRLRFTKRSEGEAA
ncbi:hypothetical protein D3C87_1485440 [compost metagenome]